MREAALATNGQQENTQGEFINEAHANLGGNRLLDAIRILGGGCHGGRSCYGD